MQTENIPLTQQPDFMTPLPDNTQKRSTEISKNKKGHKPDKPDSDSMVNPDPEPSSSYSSSKTS